MDIWTLVFGIVTVVGTAFSIIGAFKSTTESKKAERFLKEINEKKSAFDLGIISSKIEKFHKDIYTQMIAKRVTRGANKEIDIYRKWCDELTVILNDIPIDMVNIIKQLEEVKHILNSCIIKEISLHDLEYENDSSFKKVEASVYYVSKELKQMIHDISKTQ